MKIQVIKDQEEQSAILRHITRSNVMNGVDCGNSSGTDAYYRLGNLVPRNFVQTVGVKDIYEKHECFWLNVEMLAILPIIEQCNTYYNKVFVVKNEDTTKNDFSIIIILDQNDASLAHGQMLVMKHEFTDLKTNLELVLVNDGQNLVLMVEGEY